MPQKLIPALPVDRFTGPLRNIRSSMDGTAWTFDLIPSLTLDTPVRKSPPTGNPTEDQINKILEGSRPIVEAANLLRLEFYSVQACVVQEEFVELYDEFSIQPDSFPLLKDGKGCFPFLLVENSKWRATLPDYQGGDWPELQHYMMLSMETHVNLLGILDSIEWVKNSGG